MSVSKATFMQPVEKEVGTIYVKGLNYRLKRRTTKGL